LKLSNRACIVDPQGPSVTVARILRTSMVSNALLRNSTLVASDRARRQTTDSPPSAGDRGQLRRCSWSKLIAVSTLSSSSWDLTDHPGTSGFDNGLRLLRNETQSVIYHHAQPPLYSRRNGPVIATRISNSSDNRLETRQRL
jgi:hypothetical protein